MARATGTLLQQSWGPSILGIETQVFAGPSGVGYMYMKLFSTRFALVVSLLPSHGRNSQRDRNIKQLGHRDCTSLRKELKSNSVIQSLEGKLVGSQLLTEADQLWKSTTKFLTILEASFMQGHAMLIRGSMQKSSRERRGRVGFH